MHAKLRPLFILFMASAILQGPTVFATPPSSVPPPTTAPVVPTTAWSYGTYTESKGPLGAVYAWVDSDSPSGVLWVESIQDTHEVFWTFFRGVEKGPNGQPSTQQNLRFLGRQGWELVAVTNTERDRERNFYFKRPRQDAPKPD